MGFVVDFTNTQDSQLAARSPVPRGQYHVACVSASEAVNRESTAFGINLELEVLAGNNSAGIGKKIRETLKYPSPTNKDHGEFLTSRLFKACEAAGIGTREALKSFKGEIEPNWFFGRHFLVVTKINDRGYAEVDGVNFYHLNDPEYSHVPQNRRLAEAFLQDVKPIVGAASDSFAGV